MLQVICAAPAKVPAEKLSEAGLVLHSLNARLRMGCFQFHAEERVIAFRLAMPIRPEAELAAQFHQALGAALTTMDEHIRTLGLLACSTQEAQQALADLSPAPELLGASPRLPGGRLEMN